MTENGTKNETQEIKTDNEDKNLPYPAIVLHTPHNVLQSYGYDKLGRNILMINTNRIPKNETIDLDELANVIINAVDKIADHEYVLVYVNSALSTVNQPSMNWLRKIYSGLGFKYRKNIKALYLVHPSLWTKTVFLVMKPLLSQKFWKKLIYIDTVDQIYQYVERSQITFSRDVYLYEELRDKINIKVFGMSLDTLLARKDQAIGIPSFVEQAITYLDNYGLEAEGLFRMSGDVTEMKIMQQQIDEGMDISFNNRTLLHSVSGLLKKYFRELPEPLFTHALYTKFLEMSVIEDRDFKRKRCIELLNALPPANRRLVKFFMSFLQRVAAFSDKNKMTSENLALVIGPNLLALKGATSEQQLKDVKLVCKTIQYLIDDYSPLFFLYRI